MCINEDEMIDDMLNDDPVSDHGLGLNFAWTLRQVTTFLEIKLPTIEEICTGELDNQIEDYGNDYFSDYVGNLLQMYADTYPDYNTERNRVLKKNYHIVVEPIPIEITLDLSNGLQYFRKLCDLLRCY